MTTVAGVPPFHSGGTHAERWASTAAGSGSERTCRQSAARLGWVEGRRDAVEGIELQHRSLDCEHLKRKTFVQATTLVCRSRRSRNGRVMFSLIPPCRSRNCPQRGMCWKRWPSTRAVARYEPGNKQRYASRLYSHDAPTTWTRSPRVRYTCPRGWSGLIVDAPGVRPRGESAHPFLHSGSGGGCGHHPTARMKSSQRLHDRWRGHRF